MNIPLSLYDYLAVFVPGTLILVGFSPALQIGSADLRPSGVLEIAVLAVLAFVAGHFTQWLAKALLVALAQFFPQFNNTGAYLLRNPYPTLPPASSPTTKKRVQGVLKSVIPFYWSMQRLNPTRAERIKASLLDYYGYEVRPEESIGRILSALELADRKEILAKREQFQAQADFFRGTAVSLAVWAGCVLAWGPPGLLVPQGRLTVKVPVLVGLLLVVAGAFIKRYLQHEFNTASALFSSFEGLVRHRSKQLKAD